MLRKKSASLAPILCLSLFSALALTMFFAETCLAADKVFKWRAQSFLTSQQESYKEFVRFCEKLKVARTEDWKSSLFKPEQLFLLPSSGMQ